ncbi:MAG: hypothetical protein U0Q21_09685 [Dermatophilaceae bacterium]
MTDEIKRGVDAMVKAAHKRGYPVDGMAIGGGSPTHPWDDSRWLTTT